MKFCSYTLTQPLPIADIIKTFRDVTQVALTVQLLDLGLGFATKIKNSFIGCRDTNLNQEQKVVMRRDMLRQSSISRNRLFKC